MTRDERQKELDKVLFNYEPKIGDGGFPIYLLGVPCNWCKHYHGDDKCSCDAYPNGIPDKFAIRYGNILPQAHFSIKPDQVGTFVFEDIIKG